MEATTARPSTQTLHAEGQAGPVHRAACTGFPAVNAPDPLVRQLAQLAPTITAAQAKVAAACRHRTDGYSLGALLSAVRGEPWECTAEIVQILEQPLQAEPEGVRAIRLLEEIRAAVRRTLAEQCEDDAVTHYDLCAIEGER